MKPATLTAILVFAAAMAKSEVCCAAPTLASGDSLNPGSETGQSTIPEPSTVSLLGGFGIILLLRRKP